MAKKRTPREKIQREINRLELELFQGLPRMFEPEIVTRRKEIEALRKTLGERPKTRRRKPKPGREQGVLFK